MRLSTPRWRIASLAAVAAFTLYGPFQLAHAQAYLSGPSIVYAGETVTLSGGGFRPSDFVNVAVSPPPASRPLLQAQAQAYATSGSGNVDVTVTPAVAGLYVVTVTNSAGETLATANFIVW